VKNATAKTITITGTPTATVSYSITTVGSGTAATGSGTITVSPASSQTLNSTTNNNQTVNTGTAISTIVFTWGGDATDATVTGLPASGISFVKDATAKTITINGTPTATLSYSITTSGLAGTPATGSGTITVTIGSTGDMVHNFTASGKTSSFYTITGNLSTGYGTVSYDGLSLTQCLKMESSTNIAFTTTQPGTLTLVFNGAYAGSIKVDGTTYNITASASVLTVSVAAGAHTISKLSGSTYLFYMNIVYGTSGVKNMYAISLNIYPNPVKNILNIESNDKIEKIELFTLTGVDVKKVCINDNEIDVSELKKGSYLMKVTTVQGFKSLQIIKE